MIAIIDYRMGNITSVFNALSVLGCEAVITSVESEIQQADRLILPGVGAFGDGMANIREMQLDHLLKTAVLEIRKPILGICLGMQLMCKESFEFGHHEGLSWVEASVKPLSEKIDLVTPHMGWNNITLCRPNPLIPEAGPLDFYFVHSFYVECKNAQDVIATCNYGIDFVCAFQKDNIFGVQFHPEKSQSAGMALLKRFLAI